MLAYALMFALILSTIGMVVIGGNCSRLFVKILHIRPGTIVPVVLALCMIGSFSARNSLFDVLLCILFGAAGLWLKRAEIPLSPILIAMILGQMLEENFRRSLMIAAAKDESVFHYVFVRPVSIALIAVVGLLIFANMKMAIRKNNTEE